MAWSCSSWFSVVVCFDFHLVDMYHLAFDLHFEFRLAVRGSCRKNAYRARWFYYLFTSGSSVVTLSWTEWVRRVWLVNFFNSVGKTEIYKSSHQTCSIRKGVLRNFTKFTRKHLYQSLFFNKVADLQPWVCSFIKKRLHLTFLLHHSCFPMKFSKFLRTPFFAEHLR